MNYARARINKFEALELFVLGVFVYAASDKLWHSLKFKAALLRVDYLPASWVAFISIAVPSIELIIVALCLYNRTKQAGWTFALLLLTVFTMHLVFLLVFQTGTMCGCGGLLDELGIPMHIALNVILIFSALILLKRG